MDYLIRTIPVAKPRQTRSDRWKKRKSVVKYRNFADILKLECKNFRSNGHIMMAFYLPFPKSYSNKQRIALAGKPHTLRPDIDNLVKSVLDALFENDSHIYSIVAVKWWQRSDGPCIFIRT